MGLVDASEVAWRTSTTLRRTLSEAVFAQAVLIVEGVSDAALLEGVADRDGGFDGAGIAIVQANGKTTMPMVWAILAELGIPELHGVRRRQQRRDTNAAERQVGR